MKEAKELKCELHNLPILKIEMHSKKLLCEKCTTEPDQQRKQRLELQRIKIHKHYQISLQQLKTVKERTDKLVQLFQSRNMSEAKKIINKSSSEVQKIVQSLLQREVKQANKCLKQTAEKQLQYWKIIDGRTFCSTYLQFEQQYQKIQQRLNALKQNLKQQICDKMKVEIRNYYCSLFQF